MYFIAHRIKHTLFLAMLLLLSCTQQPEMAGTYTETTDTASEKPSEIKLQPNHEGLWTSEIDMLSFQWSTERGEIHLHTQAHDTLSGELTDTGFTIRLSRQKTLEFKRNP